jgi:hypothetical protein
LMRSMKTKRNGIEFYSFSSFIWIKNRSWHHSEEWYLREMYHIWSWVGCQFYNWVGQLKRNIGRFLDNLRLRWFERFSDEVWLRRSGESTTGSTWFMMWSFCQTRLSLSMKSCQTENSKGIILSGYRIVSGMFRFARRTEKEWRLKDQELSSGNDWEGIMKTDLFMIVWNGWIFERMWNVNRRNWRNRLFECDNSFVRKAKEQKINRSIDQ